MIQNIRDLGGLPARGGKIIREGCLVRSANLTQAEAQDLAGISAVIDLRTTVERSQGPDMVHGREYLPMPVFDEMRAGISHEIGAEKNGVPDMRILYRWMIEKHGSAFSKVLSAIMNHDFSSGAILWHCTEGKDRCGLTSALVLELLGVERDVIMEDYLKTNEINLSRAARIREQLKESRGEAFAESIYKAFIADAAYLEAAWEAMGPDYFGKIGISDEEIEAFRERVLQPKTS